MMDEVDLLERAFEVAEAVVEKVDADQLGEPTPCDEWDVRALLSHLVLGNRRFAAQIEGDEPPDPSRDPLGRDHVKAFRASAEICEAAFRADGALERTYQAGIGEVDGTTFAMLRVVEAVVHGWDLAKATGQDTAFDPEVAEPALRFTRGRLEGQPRPPTFGPEQPTPPDSTPADRLAAYLGRTV